MVKKLVSFYIDNSSYHKVSIDTILKETSVTYTLKNKDGIEYKRKKNDVHLDEMVTSYTLYTDGYPANVKSAIITEEEDVTDEMLEKILSSMRQILITEIEKCMLTLQQKINDLKEKNKKTAI